MPEFTLRESKILHVLKDGKYHSKKELFDILGDPVLEERNVNVLVCEIRKKLRPIGEDLLLEMTGGVTQWRHVRIVSIN